MIRKYTFGSPLTTGAVVTDVPAETSPLPFFAVSREGNRVHFSADLGEEEILFGLGENVRGINKRGHCYRSWNIDEFNHTEDRQNLYASHNFLIFFSPDRLFGLFLDDPGLITWDLGCTRIDRCEIISENGDLDVYLLEGESLKDIARSFRRLTGRSYIPPRWAFGYIQSRWGYAGEREVHEVVDEHRRRHIPLDSVCLDIDYMDRYRNFTWDLSAFPDLKRFSGEMAREHIHLVPIIDAGICAEEGYAPFDTGKEQGALCEKEDGTLFEGAVWPGLCAFPDFLNQRGRTWFGEQYRPLLEAGIEGFWNDMNEPAIFFTEAGLTECYRQVEEGRRLTEKRESKADFEGMWNIKGAFTRLANNPEDFRSFYHRTDDGQRVRHDRVHNLYGGGMTRASSEGFARFDPDRRFLLFSRSSCIGAHRYGGVWMGDNYSWWEHIRLTLHMLPAMNLCGFLFTGADLGGFNCDVTEDLLARCLQLGVFTPLMRNHSALHTRLQEIYRFSTWEKMRNTVTVRYALIPYLYSEFMKAALSDGMYFRPMAFDYPGDARAVRTEDQLMLGEDCMIAPVMEPNAAGRYVYLPEDMLLIRFRSADDYDLESLSAGDHFIPLGLHEFPLFVRKNHAVLLCPGGESSELLDDHTFTVLGRIPEGAEIYLYRDDGITACPDLQAGLTHVSLPADGEFARPLRL